MQVMAKQVVAEHQLRVCGEGLQLRQRTVLVEAPLAQEGPLAPDGADLVDLAIGARLQVEQEAA